MVLHCSIERHFATLYFNNSPRLHLKSFQILYTTRAEIVSLRGSQVQRQVNTYSASTHLLFPLHYVSVQIPIKGSALGQNCKIMGLEECSADEGIIDPKILLNPAQWQTMIQHEENGVKSTNHYSIQATIRHFGAQSATRCVLQKEEPQYHRHRTSLRDWPQHCSHKPSIQFYIQLPYKTLFQCSKPCLTAASRQDMPQSSFQSILDTNTQAVSSLRSYHKEAISFKVNHCQIKHCSNSMLFFKFSQIFSQTNPSYKVTKLSSTINPKPRAKS